MIYRNFFIWQHILNKCQFQIWPLFNQKCIWTCFHISYQTRSWQKSFIYYNQMIHWVVNLDCDKTGPGRDPKILGTNTHWPVATALWLPNPNIELENSWLLKTVSWFPKYVLCAFKLASRYQEGTFLFLEASFISRHRNRVVQCLHEYWGRFIACCQKNWLSNWHLNHYDTCYE